MAPACFDPLTARIAAGVGFECIALGGYALGSASAISEPLMTMTEVVDAARRITLGVDVPLIVDAATGFGDPLHVMRTVREFERAGVAAIHIEDQVFPKRAHYHRDYREHTVSAEEMVDKVRFACQARAGPGLRDRGADRHDADRGLRRGHPPGAALRRGRRRHGDAVPEHAPRRPPARRATARFR